MLLPGRLLLLPPGSRVPSATWQQQQAQGRSVASASPCCRQGRREVLLHAKKRATESSEEPAPAAAGRKGRKKKADLEAAAAEAAADAAAEAAASAAEQAALGAWIDSGGSPEEDRRRFPYHRRLQNAASDGNIDGAESAFTGMEAAGMPPGPRAYHVLLCAHQKGGDTPGALGVAGRATAAGVQLLPESYAVLIFAAMESSPPDVDVAQTLYAALSGTDTDPQLPWSTLCRLLASKGCGAEAVAAVKDGIRAGLEVDADVAEAYLKGLCDTEQLDAALTFLEVMAPKYGIKPEARHVTYVVAALAAAGNFDDASSLIDVAGNRGWGRNAGTFNALMAGIVRQLENDDEEQTLAFTFNKMTGRMVQCGVRPNKFTFKLEAEGHVKLKDPRSTMGSIKSLRTAAGANGLQLVDPAALAGLLQLLSERDMPVDMLQLLVYMAEDGARMPPGALAPDGEGVTPLDAWLSGHLEGMAARADQRVTEATMLNTPLEYVNGIPIGPGQCVVDEGGSIVPVSKCSVKELRAEAEARQISGATDMKRPDLVAAIKAARARLPFNVLQAQVKTAGEGVRGGSKKKAAAAGPKKRKGRGPAREVWVFDNVNNLEIQQAPPDSAFRTEAEKFLLSESALDDIDITDDQYALAANKNNKEIDFDALLEARMLDEGTAAVMNVGDEDVMSGFATLLPTADGDDEDGAADDEDEAKGGGELDEEAWRKMQSFEARSIDPQTLQEGYRQLQFLEAQQIDTDEANLVAGMDIAMDIVRAAETVGGRVSPADLLLLVSGALAERNVNAAADIARRLALLLAPEGAVQQQQQQYSPDFVLQQYESLAEMCIAQRAVQQADVVLEAAEGAGLQPSQAVLAKLAAALRGQPRRSERLGRENAALLERAGVDDLGDLSLSGQQLQQQLPADAASTTAAAAAAAAAAAGAAVADGLPSTELAVEALSVQDPPLDQQQQQQQDEELPPDLQGVADVLDDVGEWLNKQQKMASVLSKLGFDNDALNDIMMQPAALMADLSWLPANILAATMDPAEAWLAGAEEGGEGEEGKGGEGGKQEPGEPQPPKSIEEMSLADLARACADDTLSPEQTEELVDALEAAGVPVLYDELERRILWPGSPEYDAWAADSPQEAAEDEEFLVAAMREQFAEELSAAESGAEEVGALLQQQLEEGLTPEQLQADEPDMQQYLSLRQQYNEVLQELGLSPNDEQDEAAEGDEEGEQQSPEERAASKAEREEMLQQVQEQLQQLIDERQDELREVYQQLGLPLPDLRLDEGGDGGGGGDSGDGDGDGGDDGGSSSGSSSGRGSRRRQLTGR